MTNPMNYKTQSGLLDALSRASEKPMGVRHAWFYEQAKWALINNFGWDESAAALLIADRKSKVTAYRG